MGRDEPAKYFQSFQGAHQACVMEHLQFGVVLDESVSLERAQAVFRCLSTQRSDSIRA